MGLNLSLPKNTDLKPKIIVIGVGGAGGNAVNNMVNSGLEGVEFVVANTDAQALAFSKAERRIQMGGGITQGLGAGMRPDVGEQSATDSLEEIKAQLEGAHMLFIAAGMGGGTGTGAAPVIAQVARDMGILTVAIVTKPFQFEGTRRMTIAEAGLERLYDNVDTLITIPNQNLFRIANEQTTITDAFAKADEVLNSGVRGITDLMVVPGLINLDFADVRTIMDEMGKAMMGTGEATGERRAIEAAESAISNPLLDDVSLKGARGVLVNITGGKDLTLYEVEEAASLIQGQVDKDANIIIGSALDPDLDGVVRVSVVATGVCNASGENFYTPRAQTNASTYTNTTAVQSETYRAESESVSVNIPPVGDLNRAPVYDLDEPLDLGEDAVAHRDDVPEYMRDTDTDNFTDEDIERVTRHHYPSDDEPIYQPSPDPQPVIKRPFGFFGRKKSVTVAAKPPMPTPRDTGDLFEEPREEELEIPAFLRRSGQSR